MNRKNYNLIPVLAAIILIPQLMFWWLAPVSASAFLTVYIAGTALTFAIPLTCFLIYFRENIRKTAGLFLVCGVLDLIAVTLSALLLGVNASVRTTVFSFLILMLVDLILLLLLGSGIQGTQSHGIKPLDESVEMIDNVSSDPGDPVREYREVTTSNSVRNRPIRQNTNEVPLPHRKH